MHTERAPVMNSITVEIGSLADGKVSDRDQKKNPKKTASTNEARAACFFQR